VRSFEGLFGHRPTVVRDAPGRVNLIGEHTDYNGGFVLPMAIPQRTRVELAPQPDCLVRVWSASFPSTGPLEYSLGEETSGRGWLDYVQGVTDVLRKAGYAPSGFDARIESSVPLGSGLASSAALEVSLLRALRSAFTLALEEVELARLGQRAENEFVGARVGIMDQMAASLAEAGEALFVDTRDLSYQRVPLPADAEIAVISSGIAHSNVAGEYNARRAECKRACALLGVGQLRDLATADLGRVEALPEPLGRRARHVITENERVLAAVEAMKAGDLRRLGELFYASHASMRDDYQVSILEIDLMVELASAEPNVFGARLTGGGFGGSVVVLVRAGWAADLADRIARGYAERTGRSPAVLMPAPGAV